MHRFPFPQIAVAALAASLASAGWAAPVVSDAGIRLPAVTGRPAAGFLMVTSDKADALTGVSTPKAGRVEMHSVAAENGVMRMRAQTSMAVPAGGMLHMGPGGNHLMLFDLASDVKAGDTVPLILTFQSGATVTANARVSAPGAMPASHGDHKH